MFLCGPDLAKPRPAFNPLRITATIDCASNRHVDQYSIMLNLCRHIGVLEVVGRESGIRSVGVTNLCLTVPEAVPVAWHVLQIAEIPNSVPRADVERAAAKHFKSYALEWPDGCWETEIHDLRPRTWLAPLQFPSVLAREFVCIEEDVRENHEPAATVLENGRRLLPAKKARDKKVEN